MNKSTWMIVSCLTLLSLLCFKSYADTKTVTLYKTYHDKHAIGQIVFNDTEFGLLILPHLSSLPSGLHGFHLHQHADCGHVGMQAGGHYDPNNTNSHQGPYGMGHLGDLPVLYVTEDGEANTPVLAPRLKASDLNGLSVMIHAGGDHYTDNPPLGGGGSRIACGPVN